MNYQDFSVLLEVSRTRRAVDSGEITDPKTIKMFKRRGWIPTKKKETSGLHKAARNMAKKYGYKVLTRDNDIESSLTTPIDNKGDALQWTNNGPLYISPGTMFIPSTKVTKKATGIDPLYSASVGWHEGREASRYRSKYAKKLSAVRRKVSNKLDNITDFAENVRAHNKYDKFNEIFGHHNPGVLRDEAKLGKRLLRRHGVDIIQGTRSEGEQLLSQVSPRRETNTLIHVYKKHFGVK